MKIKALFLLFIFLLNSAIGLNCVLHKDSDCCDESAGPHHQELTLQTQYTHQSFTTVAQEDPCCQDAVNNFASLAKLVPQSVKIFIPVPVAYVRSEYPYTCMPASVVKIAHQLLIDERQRPPTPDIRIAIQSLQV